MHYYSAEIRYKGTSFHGWQAQAVDTSDEKHPTIQGSLQAALYRVFQSKDCIVTGTSRTDAGVHAEQQIARFQTSTHLPPLELQAILNQMLAPDISISSLKDSDQGFLPSSSVSLKTYHYFFSFGSSSTPCLSSHVTHFPMALDIARMKSASALFLGAHDFHNFHLRSTDSKDGLRDIKCIYLEEIENPFSSQKLFKFEFQATGFLKQMIRLIVKALVLHGQDKLSENQIRELLTNPQEKMFAKSAPPQGLILRSINFIDQ